MSNSCSNIHKLRIYQLIISSISFSWDKFFNVKWHFSDSDCGEEEIGDRVDHSDGSKSSDEEMAEKRDTSSKEDESNIYDEESSEEDTHQHEYDAYDGISFYYIKTVVSWDTYENRQKA